MYHVFLRDFHTCEQIFCTIEDELFKGTFCFQVVGFVMTILAMSSILAYNCHFHDTFTETPAGYMFHLMYYRSHHCDRFIDWSLLGIENMTAGIEPQTPHEIDSVTRTFWFAVIQVIFNCLLAIASVNMLRTILITKYSLKSFWRKKYNTQFQRNSTGLSKPVGYLTGCFLHHLVLFPSQRASLIWSPATTIV